MRTYRDRKLTFDVFLCSLSSYNFVILRIHFCISFLFFFFPATCFDFSAVNSAPMHCSQVPQTSLSATFSLKMGSTALFTHLKIILLQCFQFSVFSFSKIILSKRTLSQLNIHKSNSFFPLKNHHINSSNNLSYDFSRSIKLIWGSLLTSLYLSFRCLCKK